MLMQGLVFVGNCLNSGGRLLYCKPGGLYASQQAAGVRVFNLAGTKSEGCCPDTAEWGHLGRKPGVCQALVSPCLDRTTILALSTDGCHVALENGDIYTLLEQSDRQNQATDAGTGNEHSQWPLLLSCSLAVTGDCMV